MPRLRDFVTLLSVGFGLGWILGDSIWQQLPMYYREMSGIDLDLGLFLSTAGFAGSFINILQIIFMNHVFPDWKRRHLMERLIIPFVLISGVIILGVLTWTWHILVNDFPLPLIIMTVCANYFGSFTYLVIIPHFTAYHHPQAAAAILTGANTGAVFCALLSLGQMPIDHEPFFSVSTYFTIVLAALVLSPIAYTYFRAVGDVYPPIDSQSDAALTSPLLSGNALTDSPVRNPAASLRTVAGSLPPTIATPTTPTNPPAHATLPLSPNPPRTEYALCNFCASSIAAWPRPLRPIFRFLATHCAIMLPPRAIVVAVTLASVASVAWAYPPAWISVAAAHTSTDCRTESTSVVLRWSLSLAMAVVPLGSITAAVAPCRPWLVAVPMAAQFAAFAVECCAVFGFQRWFWLTPAGMVTLVGVHASIRVLETYIQASMFAALADGLVIPLSVLDDEAAGHGGEAAQPSYPYSASDAGASPLGTVSINSVAGSPGALSERDSIRRVCPAAPAGAHGKGTFGPCNGPEARGRVTWHIEAFATTCVTLNALVAFVMWYPFRLPECHPLVSPSVTPSF